MIKYVSNSYDRVRISLDNQSYENCVFANCTIVYAGTGPISLVGCTFNNCQWVFAGNALNTLNFMQTMYHQMGDFGKTMIEETCTNIKRGAIPNVDDDKEPKK